MSSEDVIELGSSDDEAAPAPKKRKPIPNAMVHIPGKKQFKSYQNRQSPKYAPVMQQANNKRFSIVPVRVASNIKQPITNKSLPITISKGLQLNPLSLNNSNMYSKNKMPIKAPPKILPKLPPGITITKTGTSKPTAQSLNKRTLTHTSLPAQKKAKILPQVQKVITVNNKLKKMVKAAPVTVELDDEEESSSVPNHKWYLKPEQQKSCKKVTTPVKKSNTDNQLTLMEKNNKEPLKTFVEITIEDSPVKPTKKQSEVGKELPITIDDSPNKLIDTNNKRGTKAITSDEEKSSETKQAPPSKKKLSYPENVMIEINIDGIQMNNNPDPPCSNENNVNERDCKTPSTERETEATCTDNEVITLEDTPQKTEEENFVFKKITLPLLTVETKTLKDNTIASKTTSSPAKPTSPPTKPTPLAATFTSPPAIPTSPTKPTSPPTKPTSPPTKPTSPPTKPTSPSAKPMSPSAKPTVSAKKCNAEKENNIFNGSEIHPEYKKFIELCFELENSDDMKKIVEKKILGYYKQVPKEYTESEGFIEIVSSKIAAMKVCPDNMYLHIKDVVDELNLQRKIAKAQLEIKEKEKESSSNVIVEDSDPKRISQIRKLEKTLKKLHRAIQRLEEQEVDFDDEADSVYLLTDRYKERLMKVHKKLCQLTNTKLPSEPRIHIESRSGRPLGPARRLEKWINKKVPVGTPLPFPDFHDVVRCVKEANEEDGLLWNDFEVMDEARDLFVRCGKKLKRRRQENEWRLASSRIAADIDPAEESADLKKKLEENKTAADRKESDVINKYADRQNLLKLEAVEINEKEADESPAESDDEVQEIPITTNELDNNTVPGNSSEKESLESQEESDNDVQEISITTNKSDDNISQRNHSEEFKNNFKFNDEVSLDKHNNEKDDINTTNEVKGNEKNDIEKEENQNKQNEITQTDNKNDEFKDKENDKNKEPESSIAKNNTYNDNNFDDTNNINEISDDEGDELNLLEEINLDYEVKSSSLESLSESDDESPIAISDSVESTEETTEKGLISSDVESIVLSSSDEDSINTSTETVKTVIEKNVSEGTSNMNCFNEKKNDESGESNGSTEDDSIDDNNTSNMNSPNCVNLRDDSITIDETIIAPNKDLSELLNLKHDSITIDETIIAPNEVESSTSKSLDLKDDSITIEPDKADSPNSSKSVNLKDHSMTIDETINASNRVDSSKSINLSVDGTTIDTTIIAQKINSPNLYESEDTLTKEILRDIETALDEINDLDRCNTLNNSEVILDKEIYLTGSPKVSSNVSVEQQTVVNLKTADCAEFEKCAKTNENEIDIESKKNYDDSEKRNVDSTKVAVDSDKMDVDSNKLDVGNDKIDTSNQRETTVDNKENDNSKEIISDIVEIEKDTTDVMNNDNGNNEIDNTINKISFDDSTVKNTIDNIENIKIDTNKVVKPIPNNEQMEI